MLLLNIFFQFIMIGSFWCWGTRILAWGRISESIESEKSVLDEDAGSVSSASRSSGLGSSLGSGIGSGIGDLAISFLCALYALTMGLFLLLLMGLPISIASLLMLMAVSISALVGLVIALRKKRLHLGAFSIFWQTLRASPLIWLLLALVVILFSFSFYYIYQSPLIYDDAIRHWSGRARSLYGQANWSWDKESPVFLGHVGANHYPLAIPIWRAFVCLLYGGWDDTVAQFDGVLIGLTLLALVWANVRKLVSQTWIAVLAVLVVMGFPLFRWHLISGYADLHTSAFMLGAFYCLLNKKWLMAGMLTAGTMWVKNDGVALYFPSLSMMALLLQPWDFKKAGRQLGLFVLGLASILPWIIFRMIAGLKLSPNDEGLSWHPEAFDLFWKNVIHGEEYNQFWWPLLIAVLCSFMRVIRNQQDRAVLMTYGAMLFLGSFVFFATDAYVFMENEMTIHRTMLQILPAGVILFCLGLGRIRWLDVKEEA